MTQIVVSFSADTDPAVGWNLFLKHYSTPDVPGYEGTLNPSSRQAVFHNIQGGLYVGGIQRVELVDDNGISRRIEGDMKTFAVLDGQVIATSGASGLTIDTVTVDPNGT